MKECNIILRNNIIYRIKNPVELLRFTKYHNNLNDTITVKLLNFLHNI